jgi:lipopolysaccharide assembly protein A
MPSTDRQLPPEPIATTDPERAVDHPPEAPTVRRSRFGGLWIGMIVAAVILVLLLIFVLQNSQNVQVDYFGLSGQLPLAVAILLGVAAGALLVALPGTLRILQLRKTIRRQ